MQNRDWEVSPEKKGIKGNTIQDFLYFEGMYNPLLRFAFTNILDEDFVSYWNGKRYIVKPHDSVKVPHHLAQKFTKEIVDMMMQAEKKGLMMAVPANRKPYEDKVLSLLPSEEGTELEVIRDEFIESVKRDSERKEGEPDAQSPSENIQLDFEDLRNRTQVSAPEVPEVEPVRRGRPRKIS